MTSNFAPTIGWFARALFLSAVALTTACGSGGSEDTAAAEDAEALRRRSRPAPTPTPTPPPVDPTTVEYA
jgi:hypothetical protein